MKKYYDTENQKVITEDELRAEYEVLKKNGETEAENFGQYLNNCTGKNGTLEVIK